MVEPAFERPSDNEATRRWCGQLLGMYRAWAGQPAHAARRDRRRRASATCPWLLISGFGAHRLLAQEVGLHVLELADDEAAPAGRPRGCGSPSRRWAICRPTGSAAR